MLWAASLFLVVMACKKDPAQDVITAMEPRAVDVVDLVEGFVTKAHGERHTKDLEMLSLDSAVWYIESALNYEVAEAWLECQFHLIDSVEFTLDHNGGQAAYSDVLDAFLDMEASISPMIEPGTNHLVIADVKTAPLLNGQPGKIYLVFGHGYNKNVNATFGPNDYWYSGGMMTHCGCGPNIGAQGECADKQIQARINMPIPLPSVNCFFTDIVSLCVGVPVGYQCDSFLPHDMFPSGVPETPFKIYSCGPGLVNCPSCFPPEWMSFYTQGTYDVMIQLTPSNSQTINAKVDWFGMLNGPDLSYYSHSTNFRYGRVNCKR